MRWVIKPSSASHCASSRESEAARYFSSRAAKKVLVIGGKIAKSLFQGCFAGRQGVAGNRVGLGLGLPLQDLGLFAGTDIAACCQDYQQR